MQNRENIIVYKGHLTFSTIGRLLTLLKSKMAEKGIKAGTYKRILSVMIEILENVYKYSDQYQQIPFISKNYLPNFSIQREENIYALRCSNPIRKKHIDKLRKKIDKINKTNEKELRLLYRQTISNGEFTSKGGAGLGLIEMAKISGHKLEYHFESINEEFSLYSIKIRF